MLGVQNEGYSVRRCILLVRVEMYRRTRGKNSMLRIWCGDVMCL